MNERIRPASRGSISRVHRGSGLIALRCSKLANLGFLVGQFAPHLAQALAGRDLQWIRNLPTSGSHRPHCRACYATPNAPAIMRTMPFFFFLLTCSWRSREADKLGPTPYLGPFFRLSSPSMATYPDVQENIKAKFARCLYCTGAMRPNRPE